MKMFGNTYQAAFTAKCSCGWKFTTGTWNGSANAFKDHLKEVDDENRRT